MRLTVAQGDEQLIRLENAIAAFKSRPVREQSRMAHLLAALERERAALKSASARMQTGSSRLRVLARTA
jgi:hypothetical protein